MPNLPRNEYPHFISEKLPFSMKFHEHFLMKILTPLMRQLLSHINEEYVVIASCLEMTLTYQGSILVLKKNIYLFL